MHRRGTGFTLVELLMGDGSARFFSNDIDLATWRGLGTSRGGELDREFDR